MDRMAYVDMVALEDEHWWFVGRREIINCFLRTLPLPQSARILELGCGSGGNFAFLSNFGQVYGAEYDTEARHHAQARGIAKQVESCRLPDQIPFADQVFDLILLLDVLEHVQNDGASLEAIRGRLANQGRLVLTVPAFQFLWSAHDHRLHHFRRYTRQSLKRRLIEAGFAIEYVSYFDAIFFPPVALIRLTKKLLSRAENADGAAPELDMPPRVLNRLLSVVFASERFVVGRSRFPFGVSLIASARRNSA